MTQTQSTKRETLKLLCKSILNRLENRKSIAFIPRLRQTIQDEIYTMVQRDVLTDEDLRDRTLARIGAKAEDLKDAGFTDSDQYRTAKSIVRAEFGDDELHGFYFQKPLRQVALGMAKYFMASSNIEDVFEDDAELERQIVELVQKFNASEMH